MTLDELQSILIRELPQWLGLGRLMKIGRVNWEWYHESRKVLKGREIPTEIAFYNYEIMKLHNHKLCSYEIERVPKSGRWLIRQLPELMGRLEYGAGVELWNCWVKRNHIEWARHIPIDKEIAIIESNNMSWKAGRIIEGIRKYKNDFDDDNVKMDAVFHAAINCLYRGDEEVFDYIIRHLMDSEKLSMLIDMMAAGNCVPTWSIDCFKEMRYKFYKRGPVNNPKIRPAKKFENPLWDSSGGKLAGPYLWNRFVDGITKVEENIYE